MHAPRSLFGESMALEYQRQNQDNLYLFPSKKFEMALA